MEEMERNNSKKSILTTIKAVGSDISPNFSKTQKHFKNYSKHDFKYNNLNDKCLSPIKQNYDTEKLNLKENNRPIIDNPPAKSIKGIPIKNFSDILFANKLVSSNANSDRILSTKTNQYKKIFVKK